jgi:hypothetical protein
MISRVIKVAGLPVIALLLSIAGFAQTIRGKVTDSAGRAVPYASVNLKNSVTNRIVAYAVTDTGGAYHLQIPAGTPLNGLVVEATSIGYKTRSRPIADPQLAYDFRLSISVNQLRSVEIKSSRPVIILPKIQTTGLVNI